MAAPTQETQAPIDRNLLAELSRCCREGLTEELGKILDTQQDALNYFNVKLQRGQTLLHEACEADQADTVQLILLSGVNPDITGKGNVTPLHTAAVKGYTNCVKMLLEADARIHLEDGLGCNAFAKAERSKRREAVLRLLRSKELIHHVHQNNINAIENALTTSQFRSYEPRDISEALLVAVRSKADETISLLVVGGAQLLPGSLSWLNAGIETALALAIQLENVRAIATLLLCKASLNNEAQTIRSLLCEPPQEGTHVPWYIVEVFRLLANRKMKLDYQIAISILAKNYEATLELLLQTDVDLKRRQVNWGGRKLTLIHNTWIYSIAPWVVGLKLNNNHISKLPQELFDASQLRQLDLSENILSIVPEELFGLPSLEYLNLSQNKLTELPLSISKWSPLLQNLDLSSNQLTSLPTGMQSSHIETLNLSKNPFRLVPKCLCRMLTLTSLDLSTTHISQLPKEMGQLPNLVTLNLNELHIEDFPSAVLRGGISGHFRARARTSKPCSHIRVVVLGSSEHGREYLCQKLPHASVSNISQQSDRVELISWHFKPLFNKGRFIGNQKLFFNTWLLPGGRQFYPLYPCFFTSSALYLLFWDLNSVSGLREHLRPLLTQLVHYAPGANVAIIMVLHETITDTTIEQRMKLLERYLAMPMYSTLQFHQAVLLSHPHHNIHNVQADVKQRIYDIAVNMKWNGQTTLVSRHYPENYQLIATAVEKESRRCSQQQPPIRSVFMREHELWTISQAVVPNDPPDQMEIPLIVEYLLHTGTILHYPDPNYELDMLYVLSPSWLMDVLMLITVAVNSSSSSSRLGSTSFINVMPSGQQPVCSKSDIVNVLSGVMSKEFLMPFFRILSRFSIALQLSNNQVLLPSLLGHAIFTHNGTYQVGCLRRQLAPKAKALPPDMWPRVIATILRRLPYITEIFPENTAVENNASLACKSDSLSSTPKKEIKTSESYILIPRSGNLPATMITRVQPSLSPLNDNAFSDTSPQSPTQEDVGSRYSAVFRFSLDEGKSLDRLVSNTSDMDTAGTDDNVEDSPHINTSLSLESEDHLQVWANGIIFENKSFSFSLSSCQSDVSSVEEKGIEIAVSRSGHGTLLLARLCSVVTETIKEWFPNFMSSESRNQELTQLALCPRCINEGRSNVTPYLVDACVHSMAEGDSVINCRSHPETVKLSDLVPDFMMLDFPSSYHLDDLTVNTENLIHQSQRHKLFGGSYLHLEKLAIKQYKVVKQAVAEPLLELRHEAVMLSTLRHPNIISMFGFSVQLHCIVIERAPMGTLYSKLTDYDEKISRVIRFHVACQVASALTYLHKKKIVYRTLKASSILLWSMDFRSETTVKLTNFNRARFLSPTGHLERNMFETYHAPEMLKYNFREEYTAKVDIYSYGLLLYELVTRWAAFEGSLHPDKMAVNQRPKLTCANTAGYSTLVEMMQQCWQEDIQARPEAFSLVKQLRPLSYQCYLCSQVVRDCVSVRGCCLALSSRQIWVYGEDDSGTQVFILNDEDLSIRGTLHLKARATSICAIDNKVVIGLTENCVHAYDAATFRFTDRLNLQDSVSVISANDTFVFIGLANGILIYYSKLQFPKEPHEILLHNAPIFSMVAIGDHMWLTCGNKIFILNADDDVAVAKSWDGCPSNDEVYSIAVSENHSLVWSVTRDNCSVMTWDVNTCELLHKYDLTPQLTTIFNHIRMSASFQRQLLCIERSKDTLWFGLSCGVIAIFTATKEPHLITFFRAHRSSSKCLKAIHCANDRRGLSYMMISGGFGEISSLATDISQRHGYVMLWEALSAAEYKLLEKRSQETL